MRVIRRVIQLRRSRENHPLPARYRAINGTEGPWLGVGLCSSDCEILTFNR